MKEPTSANKGFSQFALLGGKFSVNLKLRAPDSYRDHKRKLHKPSNVIANAASNHKIFNMDNINIFIDISLSDLLRTK